MRPSAQRFSSTTINTAHAAGCHPRFRLEILNGMALIEISAALDAPALRRVGLGHLAGGDSPRGSPWNGCGWAAVTLYGVVNHAPESLPH